MRCLVQVSQCLEFLSWLSKKFCRYDVIRQIYSHILDLLSFFFVKQHEICEHSSYLKPFTEQIIFSDLSKCIFPYNCLNNIFLHSKFETMRCWNEHDLFSNIVICLEQVFKWDTILHQSKYKSSYYTILFQ